MFFSVHEPAAREAPVVVLIRRGPTKRVLLVLDNAEHVLRHRCVAVGGARFDAERPRAGVTIRRDSFGVPYVNGRTQEDVAFGAPTAATKKRGGTLRVGTATVGSSFEPRLLRVLVPALDRAQRQRRRETNRSRW